MKNLEQQLMDALDACFGVMMQPTQTNYDGYGKKWTLPACSNEDFIKLRREAEVKYYKAKKVFDSQNEEN